MLLPKTLEFGNSIRAHALQTAHEIMSKAFIGVEEGASLGCADEVLEQGLQILPVVRDGRVIRCITRHDVLRARLGLGPTIDE